MKTTIAIIRTSTNRQEVESQKEELMQFIIRDGVNPEEVEVIGEAGASAIKLDEKYRRNMAKVYDLISTGTIKTVYAWALDRIGRNEEFMVNFKNRLIDAGINLKIVNPSLTLLNPDGSVNNGMEIAFSLYITMAKQEMEQKKARFARSKKRNAEQGKYSGGVVKYGYKLDSNGFLVPDPNEVEVIRRIFETFATGQYSVKSLCREMGEYGYDFRWGYMWTLLTDPALIGGRSRLAKYDRSYPAIVDKPLFDKVQQILRRNRSSQSRRVTHYHFAATLLKCPDCGHSMVANNELFMCRYPDCNDHQNIRISTIDGILLAAAIQISDRINSTDALSATRRLTKKISDLELKIEATEKKRKAVEARTNRAKRLYIDGMLSEDEFRQEQDRIKDSSEALDAAVSEYHREIDSLRKNMQQLMSEKRNEIQPLKGAVKMSLHLDATEAQRYCKFVKEYVKRCTMTTCRMAVGDQVERVTRVIEISAVDGTAMTVYLQPFLKLGNRTWTRNREGRYIPFYYPEVLHEE